MPFDGRITDFRRCGATDMKVYEKQRRNFKNFKKKILRNNCQKVSKF